MDIGKMNKRLTCLGGIHVGYGEGRGISGPTVPATTGATVHEQVLHNSWMNNPVDEKTPYYVTSRIITGPRLDDDSVVNGERLRRVLAIIPLNDGAEGAKEEQSYLARLFANAVELYEAAKEMLEIPALREQYFDRLRAVFEKIERGSS